MRYFARREQRITGLKPDTFPPNFDDEIAFYNIEPLILVIM